MLNNYKIAKDAENAEKVKNAGNGKYTEDKREAST